MKEWILKHPVMTFLLVDSAIAGTVKVVQALTCMITGKPLMVREIVTSKPIPVNPEVNDKEEDDE